MPWVRLTYDVEVDEGVEWSAESLADWLTITDGASGTGPAQLPTVSRNSSNASARDKSGSPPLEQRRKKKQFEWVGTFPGNGNADGEIGNGKNGTVNGAT